MAIGFIKKIFSFGKDAVEEKPAPPQEVSDAAPSSVPSGEQGESQAPVEEKRTAAEATEAGTDDRDVSLAPSTANTETTSDEAPAGTAPAADENTVKQDESVPHPISPLAGEMPGRAEESEPPSEHPTGADDVSAPPLRPFGTSPPSTGEITGRPRQPLRTAGLLSSRRRRSQATPIGGQMPVPTSKRSSAHPAFPKVSPPPTGARRTRPRRRSRSSTGTSASVWVSPAPRRSSPVRSPVSSPNASWTRRRCRTSKIS